MKDVLDFLREGSEANLGSAELELDLHRILVGSSRAVDIALEPVHERWLEKVLKDMTRADGGFNPLGSGETVVERVQEARQKQDAKGLAEAGKVSLLAAAGLGKKSRILSPHYFADMTHAALIQAAKWNPLLDAELDDLELPPTHLLEEAPNDLDVWAKNLALSKMPKPPVLTRIAFKVPDLITVLRFFKHLCVSGDKASALFMTPDFKAQENNYGEN